MHILDLPPELHSHIVALACDDKPSLIEVSPTSALSLASSYWHAVTRPFRFHSLRVSGSRNIAKLLSSIEGHSKRDRRVRRLSLSDAIGFEGVADDESLLRHKSNAARLFRLLSFSLCTLDIDLSNSLHDTSLISLLWELHFPQLESLSIKGYYSFPTRPKKAALNRSGIAATSNFPRLERLSLDGVSNPSGLLSLNPLDGFFPSLETLEVRGLRSAVAFAKEVTGAVRQRDHALKDPEGHPSSAKVIYISSLPRTLRCLTLVCVPQSSVGQSKRARALHAEMLQILRSLTCRNVPNMQFTLQVIVEGSDTPP